MNNFPSHNEYSGVHLFNEYTAALPVNSADINQIIDEVSKGEEVDIKLAEIVFVEEQKIAEINREYLDHDFVTDVITFPYHTGRDKNTIEGTLYCCAPRIKQQAEENKEPEKKEFLRVIVHGLLHLCGYNDKTKNEKKVMRKREDFYLSELSLH